jgi:hypothetical protein
MGGFRGGGLDVRMLANGQSGGNLDLDLQRQGSCKPQATTIVPESR